MISSKVTEALRTRWKVNNSSALGFIWDRARQSRLITRATWKDVYEQEERLRPISIPYELRDENDPPFTVFGQLQKSMALDHRGLIVKWIGDACQAPHWTYCTFFTAVHILDSYLIRTTHVVQDTALGPLAAAALYIAANLRETSSDVNYMTLYNLFKLCPEVGRAEAIRDYQAHILEVLQASFLACHTPFDLIVLWMASLIHNPHFTDIMDWLGKRKILIFIYDLLIEISIICYINGLSLILPATSWLASTFTACILSLQDALRHPPEPVPSKVAAWAAQPSHVILEAVASEICHFPGGSTFLLPLIHWVLPLVDAILPLIGDDKPSSWKPTMMFLRDSVVRDPLAVPSGSFVKDCKRKAMMTVRELRKLGKNLMMKLRKQIADLSRSEGALAYPRDFATLTTSSSSVGAENLLPRKETLAQLVRPTAPFKLPARRHSIGLLAEPRRPETVGDWRRDPRRDPRYLGPRLDLQRRASTRY